MLQDLFTSFVELVRGSVAAKDKVNFIARPNGLPGEGFLINSQGNVETQLKPAVPARNHGLNALEEMRGAILWAAEKRAAEYVDPGEMLLAPGTVAVLAESTEIAVLRKYDPLKLSVWHDEIGAVLVMDDDAARLDTVTLTLDTTEIWDVLVHLDKSRPKLDHRDFMSLMRFKLCPYMEPAAAAAFLEAAKVIDFGSATSGTSAQSRNQSGFGLDVQNSVKSKVGELKDEIVVRVPIYSDPMLSEPVDVRLSVEINPVNRQFEVAPIIDELPKALRSVMATMRHILEDFVHDDGDRMAHVFYGTHLPT